MTLPAADALDERLHGLVHRLVSRKNIPHVLLAIESGDRSLRGVLAAGEAGPDGAPMRADTPFFIASVTKLFIAVLVLKLSERSLLRLDRSICDYLPQAMTAGLHRMDGTDYTARITLRHLLRHMSGLPDWLEDRPRGGVPLMDRLFAGEDRAFGFQDIAALVREELTPHFPPQSLKASRPRVRYSDTNFQLLMALIESATGHSLNEVYTRELFEPLGLRRTWLPGFAPLEPAGRPAAVWAGDRPLDLPRTMVSLRDLYSTAGDLLAFMRALVHGTLFDTPSTFRLMQERWTPFSLFLDPSSFRLPRRPIQYGAGMMRFALPRVFTPLRPIPPVIGHTGSTGTWLFYCPKLDLYLAGGVDQAEAAPLPFRVVPRLLSAAGRIV
jgi:CubicO group peptidase (beta-lactamase class C family)